MIYARRSSIYLISYYVNASLTEVNTLFNINICKYNIGHHTHLNNLEIEYFESKFDLTVICAILYDG